MRVSEAFPSRYLEGKTLDADMVLTIKSVEMEEIGQGEDISQKPVAYFRETSKGLVLNKTNANTIAGIYGDDMDNWLGKQITIFPQEVDFQGKQVLAIRVRLRAPTASPPPVEHKKHPTGNSPKERGWQAWKLAHPKLGQAELITKLGGIVHQFWPGATVAKLTDEQWNELIRTRFEPPETAAVPVPPEDDIPF